ncbi:MAG: glycosyltransferase family 9 protein [Smithellaceae bacterium]
MNAGIKKILLIQLGDIGDVVLTTPTVRAVKEAHPQADVSILVRKPSGTMLTHDQNLHEVIEISKISGSALHVIKEHIKLISRLRRAHYDLVIDLRLDDRSRFLSFLTGAPERVSRRCAKPFWHAFLYTKIVNHVPSSLPSTHPGADQSLSIVRAIGMDTNDSMPKLYVSSDDRKYAEKIIAGHGLLPHGKWLTFNPFSRWKYKEWNYGKWVELINSVWRIYHIPMLLVGSSQEYSDAEKIVSRCDGGVYNLCGGTIGEMAAIIATGSLHIGVDSAAPHIAAALEVPTVTIHGPQGWGGWRISNNIHRIITASMECVPCNSKGCNNSGESLCMEKLEANAVLQEIDKILSAQKAVH